MSWRKDYEVGEPVVDAEHHRLFDVVNEFHEACQHGEGSRECGKMLSLLVAYAEEHFRHEERLMRDSGYPLLDKHRTQHGDLVTAVFEINEKLAADPAKAIAETLKFVKNWLQDHILHDDMAIADFLLRKAGNKSQRNTPTEGIKGDTSRRASA